MRYMLLIYTDDKNDIHPGDWDDLMAEYRAFSEHVAAAGAMVVAHELQPVSTATGPRPTATASDV